jgi:hypothetical protein
MTAPNPTETARELDAIDFTALFAAQIHDLKNLLFPLLNSLDETLSNRCSGAEIGEDAASRLAILKYNGQLINDKLIQMLSLYRFNRGPYPVDIAYRPVADLIAEIIAEAKPLLGAQAIAIGSDVEAGLCWFYDRDLAAGVINNAIHNASPAPNRKSGSAPPMKTASWRSAWKTMATDFRRKSWKTAAA